MANVNVLSLPNSSTFQKTIGSPSFLAVVDSSLAPTSSPARIQLQSDALNVRPYNPATPLPWPQDVYRTLLVDTTAMVADGDGVTINGIDFTYRANPTSGGQFVTAQQLASAVNASPTLRQVLVARWEGGNIVSLRAIVPGSDTIITAPIAIANPVTVLYGGLPVTRYDAARAYGYRHYVRVAVNGGYQYTDNTNAAYMIEQAILFAQPDAQGVTDIDVSEVLRPYSVISRHSGTLLYHAEAICWGECEYGEAFSGGIDPITELPDNPANPSLRLYRVGAVNVYGIAGAALEGEDYKRYFERLRWNSAANVVDTVERLSRAPQYQTVLRSAAVQPVYVIYQGTTVSTPVEVTLDVQCVMADGSNAATTTAILGNVERSGLYSIDASWAQLGLTALEAAQNKRVLEATVTLKVGGVDWCSWKIEPDQNIESRYDTLVSWRNSLGVYEAIIMQGVSVQQTAAQPTGYVARERRATYNTALNASLDLQSSWLPSDHYVWLEDVLQSTDVEVAGVPYTITGGQLSTRADDSYVSLRLSLVPAIERRTLIS